MTLQRRQFITTAAAAGAALLASPFAQAQSAANFPDKPVRIVVPFPPGGPIDQTARILAQQLQEIWKQSVVVDNRVGASGIIAAESTLRAPADGLTLLFSVIHHTVLPSMKGGLTYDIVKDFQPLSLAAVYPIMVVVSADGPHKTMADLLKHAKAQPGKLTFGHSGPGGGAHLAGELFKLHAKVDLTDIPYKGNGPAIVDLMGGRVDVVFADIPSAIQHVQSGRLRALAMATPERSTLLPQLPTAIEMGVPGYVANTWGGLSVRTGTPPEIVTKLNADIVKALRDPETKERLQKIGAEPVPQTPKQYGDFIQAEMKKWENLVTRAKLKMN
jgi:tripartite-type tricarboxylate transporter receptor subunit TctC